MSVELHEEAGGTILNLNHESSAMYSHEHSLSQLVEEARRHWEARRQPGAAQRDISSQVSRAFTIALSREVGTQGTSVAKEVGKLLGWHVYDHQLLEHIAKEMGLRTALLESVDERQQSRLLELVEAFATAPAKSGWGAFVSESAYVHDLVETVLALGVHGECVIVGRGAAFVLPAATTLRVRLVGPVKERITELSRKLGISEREAALRVRTIDRERTDFVQDHFSKDPSDPRNYDLVLNTSHLSVAQCAELIVETLNRLQAPGKEKTTVQQSS
jgi:cytidylate kinase